jgi:UDP-glucose 4-epimerase
MKILITGGAGYIGTSLVQALTMQDEVESVVIYDNLSRGNFNLFLGQKFAGAAKISYVNGELLDSRRLAKALQGVDTVYHLAAKVSTPFANTDGHMHEQVNHWGTAELVYAIEESKVKRLIYASSTSVYGSSNKEVDEQTDPQPKTLYGISKLRGEAHVRRLGSKLKTYILRLGNVYGYNPSLRFDAVVNRFMFDAHFKNRIQIDGSGEQYRAFIEINRLAMKLGLLVRSEVPSGTYNLVDRNLQILDLVDVFKEIYPNLEFSFTNQHLKLAELRVNPNSALDKYLPPLDLPPLNEELIAFRSQFRF